MSIQCLTCFHDNPDNTLTCQVCGSPLTPNPGQSSQISSLYLLPGTLLQNGKYRVENFLGQGGFGIAYKGIDLTNSKAIAIKEYWPENAARQGKTIIWSSHITPQQRQKEIQNVVNEVRRIQKCLHPNIVRAYDGFTENNTIYIIMDFIEGKTLFKILEQEGKLPEARVKRYFIQLANAIKIIHDHQLLHRDIKPDNIIIDKSDNPIIIDFGSAREFTIDKTQRHTRLVSPGYAPYEQYLQTAKPNASTDIYAICASMYELVTGELPQTSLERKAQDILKPPRQLVPNLSPAIEQIILTGMKMEPKERFQTADELIDALNGKFVSPIFKRSRQLVQEGKLSEAIQSYQQFLNNEPNNGEATVELALVQIYFDDHQAKVTAQKAIQIKPNDGRGYGILGLVNCRQSNWSAAVKYLQQAANLSPSQSWIQANLAWALAKSGDWQQAQIAAIKALQLDSNSIFALGLQAWIFVNQNQWKTAIRSARLAITKSKQNNNYNSQELQRWVYPCLTIALDKAVVTTQATDVDRCIQEFATQVNNSSFVWGFKGWRKAIFGLWADAIPDFEQAQRQGQAPAWIFINLGIAQEQLKNISAAINAYEECNHKFPNNAFIQFRLGTLLAIQGQWSLAQPFLEKAINLNSNYAEAYHNLAWVLLNLKDQNGQVTNFRQMKSAYRQAVAIYAQQQKHQLAQGIEKAFQAIGIDLT
ncbi:MAG: protein kinase [Gloeotrichia echinulata HAB0833]